MTFSAIMKGFLSLAFMVFWLFLLIYIFQSLIIFTPWALIADFLYTALAFYAFCTLYFVFYFNFKKLIQLCLVACSYLIANFLILSPGSSALFLITTITWQACLISCVIAGVFLCFGYYNQAIDSQAFNEYLFAKYNFKIRPYLWFINIILAITLLCSLVLLPNFSMLIKAFFLMTGLVIFYYASKIIKDESLLCFYSFGMLVFSSACVVVFAYSSGLTAVMVSSFSMQILTVVSLLLLSLAITDLLITFSSFLEVGLLDKATVFSILKNIIFIVAIMIFSYCLASSYSLFAGAFAVGVNLPSFSAVLSAISSGFCNPAVVIWTINSVSVAILSQDLARSVSKPKINNNDGNSHNHLPSVRFSSQ